MFFINIRIVLKYFKSFLKHCWLIGNSNTSGIKDILNIVPTYWTNKSYRFWTLYNKNPTSLTKKKNHLTSSLFLFEYGFLVCFSLHAVLFAFDHSFCLYTAIIFDNFDIKWSDRNILKTWRKRYVKCFCECIFNSIFV